MKSSIFQNCSFKYFCLIVSIFISFSYYLWGWGFADHYFWMNMTWFPEANLMNNGSLRCMRLWMDVFGGSLISVRTLAWLLDTMAILIPYYTLMDKGLRSKYIFYLCGAFIILGPAMVTTCGPDNFTSLVIALEIVLFVKFTNASNKVFYLVLLIILSALAGLFRFPNILAVSVISLGIVLCIDSKYKWQLMFAYCISSVVLYYLLISLSMGSFDYLGLLRIDTEKYAGSVDSKHTIPGLLLRYGKSTFIGIVDILILCGSWFCINKCRIGNIVVRHILHILIPAMLLCVFLTFAFGTQGWPLGMMVIVASIMFYYSYTIWKDGEKKYAYAIAIITAIAFFPSAGSDCGFFKSLIVACALFPFAFAMMQKMTNGVKYPAYLCAVLSIVTIVQYYGDVIGKGTLSTNDNMKLVFENKEVVEGLQKLEDDIAPYYKKNHTVFYGTYPAHQLYVATGTKPLYTFFYDMDKDNEFDLNKGIDGLANNPENVFIDFTLSDARFFSIRGLRLIGENKLFNVYSY